MIDITQFDDEIQNIIHRIRNLKEDKWYSLTQELEQTLKSRWGDIHYVLEDENCYITLNEDHTKVKKRIFKRFKKTSTESGVLVSE